MYITEYVLFFLSTSYLQCKGFAPVGIEGPVDRVSLKFAVTELNNAEGVAFSWKMTKKCLS